MLGWALLLQAAAAGAPPPAAPLDFDLAKIPVNEEHCGARASGEIVVCGSNANHNRVSTPKGDYAEKPVRAEVGIGGGMTLKAHADQGALPGASSPRAMVTLTVPLGKKKKPAE